MHNSMRQMWQSHKRHSPGRLREPIRMGSVRIRPGASPSLCQSLLSRMGFFMGVSEERLLDTAKLHASDALKRRWPNRYLGKPVLGLKDCIRGLVEMGSLSQETIELTNQKSALVHWLIVHLESRRTNPIYEDKSFYRSSAWRKLRFSVLATMGAKCVACGATSKTGATLHVDHIKPRSQYPELALEVDNLQVL